MASHCIPLGPVADRIPSPHSAQAVREQASRSPDDVGGAFARQAPIIVIRGLWFVGNHSHSLRVLSATMQTSHALRAHSVRIDPTVGGGRAMACRPIGLCPPERFDRGWSANRGARCTRVSAMRNAASGSAFAAGELR